LLDTALMMNRDRIQNIGLRALIKT